MIENSLDRGYIEELKKGSYHAFDKLFAKYGEPLFCFVYSILKSSEDSKEVVQEVFVKVWERRQTLNEYLSFKSFLFSIAYHHVISNFRKKASEKKYLDQLVLISNGLSISPDVEVEYEMLSEKVDEIINNMPAQRKGIFIMSRFEGRSHAEIASKLNISVKTVENHINLSLKTLRLRLGDYALAGLLIIETINC
jgi:RNA polymerase sigma-70 factor (ECF subfamily)